MVHGYPMTSYIQLSFVYLAGLYTAKKQGIVQRGVYFQQFWKHHYFDWLLFARRAGIYGIGGGLVVGTLFYGSPAISLARVKNYYRHKFVMEKPDTKTVENNYILKI